MQRDPIEYGFWVIMAMIVIILLYWVGIEYRHLFPR